MPVPLTQPATTLSSSAPDPAGTATGMLLARAGLRGAHPRQVGLRHRHHVDARAHARRRAAVWRGGELLDRVITAGTPPIRHATFYIGSDPATIAVKPANGVDGPVRTAAHHPRPHPRRRRHRRRRRDSVGVTVKGLHRDTAGRVTGVLGHDQSGHPVTARARLTVGADGMGSRVAHWVAAGTDRIGAATGTATYGYWAGHRTDSRMVLPSRRGRRRHPYQPRAELRIRGHHPRPVPAGADPRPGHRIPPAARRRRTRASRLPRRRQPTGPLRLPGRPGHLRRASGPGWALVGDAGYFKNTITAHGLTDALRDAELLARAITAATAGNGDQAEPLADYQTTRDRLSLPLFTITDAIAAYTWDAGQVDAPAPAAQHRDGRRGRRPPRLRPPAGTHRPQHAAATRPTRRHRPAALPDRSPTVRIGDQARPSRFGGIIVQGGVTSRRGLAAAGRNGPTLGASSTRGFAAAQCETGQPHLSGEVKLAQDVADVGR